MSKRCLSLIISLAIALMMFYPLCGIVAFADASPVWDGTVAESYAGGTGTAEDPYLISNGCELAKLVGVDFGAGTAGKYYKLTCDIMLNDNTTENMWDFSTSIWCEYSFQGTFDGDGHVVSGIKINNSEDGRMGGLFQSLSGNATIKNLGIINSEIAFTGADSFAGALAGAADGNFTIDKCFVDNTVLVHSTVEVAGFIGNVGCNRAGGTLSITNCYSLAVLSGSSEAFGLFGYNWETYSGTVRNVYTIDHDLFKNDMGYTIEPENEYSNINEHGYYAHTDLEDISNMVGASAIENMDFDYDTVWAVKGGKLPYLKIFGDTYAKGLYTGTPGAVWDGAVAECYDDGDGTAANPYLISTAAQLAKLVSVDIGDETAGKYYKLTEDIILNDENTSNMWDFSTSIWCEYSFQGTFDGDGHVVSGIKINNSEDGRMGGLFQSLSGTATIKNLGIINSEIAFTGANSFAGALAGGADGNFTIEKCFVAESVAVSATSYVAGFIGNVGCNRTGRTLNISNCYSLATLSGTENAFGLFGYNWETYSGTVSCVYTVDHDLFTNDMQGQPIEAEYEYSNVLEHSWYDRHTNLWHKEYMRGDDAKEYMAGFDFDTVWDVSAGKYPYLKIFGDKYADGVCIHENTEVRGDVAPTCTESGYSGDTYCTDCGELIAEGEELQPTGEHTLGDWISDELGHWKECEVCEGKFEAAIHTYDWVETVEATAEHNGLKEEICTVCGHKSGNSEDIIFVTHTPGDVNMDGKVNNKDLTRLFQKLSGWDVEVDEAALDINGDGKVNNKDLTRLFQKLSGWDVEIF